MIPNGQTKLNQIETLIYRKPILLHRNIKICILMGITSPNVIGCEERQAHEEPRALLFRVRNPIQKGVYSFHAIKSF